CCAEQGVRSGGEDGQVEVEVFDAEDHLGPFRATDPVLLDRDRAVGPVELVVIVEQRVGVGGDPEEPLLHVAGLDRVAATPAAATRGSRCRTPARLPRPAATSARSAVARTDPISPPETKKPLDREAVGRFRGSRRVASLDYRSSCFIARTVATQ